MAQKNPPSPLFSESDLTAGTAMPNVDVAVIGAGVGGMHAAFQLALQELSVALIDCLPFAGGQCAQLYPDKPIYDIPGVPHCTGQTLTDSLLRQLQPLDIRWALGTLVQSVQRHQAAAGCDRSHRFILHTDKGMAGCNALVLATGVGAFVPRIPKIKGLDELPAGVLYTDAGTLAAQRGYKNAIILGGDDAAVQAAMQLAASDDSDARPLLVFRRGQPRADDALLQQWQKLCQQGRAGYVQGIPQAVQPATGCCNDASADANPGTGSTAWLLKVQHAGQPAQHLAMNTLLIAGGRTPQTRELLQGSALLQGKHITIEPDTCASSEPGVYVIGDAAHCKHKNRLIVTAFHEATQAAYAIYRYLRPDAPRPLEYTTSSRRLHALLKV